MKKIYVLVAFVATMLFASNANAQVGIHVGYAPESWSNENTTIDVNSYFAGLDFMVPVWQDLNLFVGGHFLWCTDRGDDNRFVFDTNHSTNVIGVEIPVLLNYSFKIDENFKITPFAGPKFSYYIKGRTRDESGHPLYEWFDEDNNSKMNHFNISAALGVAFSYQHFHLYGGYSLGLYDMDQNDATKTTVGGPFFGLALGF